MNTHTPLITKLACMITEDLSDVPAMKFLSKDWRRPSKD